LASRLAIVAVALLTLALPAIAHANGDPASDYLLGQKLFLPFSGKPDEQAVERLQKLLDAAAEDGYPIRVAIIRTPEDLGTARALMNKAQRYAQFLGLELSFVYRKRLLVVMPNGFGYAVNGDPDPGAAKVLARIPPPGNDVTKQVEAATVAVQRLAASEGHTLKVPKGGSQTRDRLVIAAASVAGAALILAFVLYRRPRGGRTLSE
jgi:hypothetical protein